MSERENSCLKKQMLICEERMATLQSLTSISASIKEQCRIEATNKCKTIVEEQLVADKVERMEACEMREVAEIEKVECRQVQLRQSRPSHEVESFCSMSAVRMEQRYRSGEASRRSANWMFQILNEASRALTINIQVIFLQHIKSSHMRLSCVFSRLPFMVPTLLLTRRLRLSSLSARSSP